MTDKRLSDEERRRRAGMRRRQELRRKRRRKVMIMRLIIALIGVFAVFLAVWGISSAIREGKKLTSTADDGQKEAVVQAAGMSEPGKYAELLAAQYDYDSAIAVLESMENAKKDEAIQAAIGEYKAEKEKLAAVDASSVRHFSFPTLLVNEAAAAEGTSPLTVEQFRQILQELYDGGYVLVDLYDLASSVKDEEGNVSYEAGVLYLPEGKKPFVLSQRDVSYPFEKAGNGYASRLIVDDEGRVVNEYKQPDGNMVTGDYDIVPCLETFISEHPDFAYRGAKGTLGLTGYNGVLGYRTSPYLAVSAAEGNPYADGYGTFDTEAEAESCKPVVQALKDGGWNFASYGNSYTSYGSEFSQMQSDADQWQANVAPVAGGTDILIFPCETDIGSWSDYTDENTKYTYLKDQGFRFFCIEEGDNLSWLQVRAGYVRQGIHEIDSYEEFQSVLALE